MFDSSEIPKAQIEKCANKLVDLGGKNRWPEGRGPKVRTERQVRTKCKFGGEVRGEQLRHVPVPSWKCTAKFFGIPT